MGRNQEVLSQIDEWFELEQYLLIVPGYRPNDWADQIQKRLMLRNSMECSRSGQSGPDTLLDMEQQLDGHFYAPLQPFSTAFSRLPQGAPDSFTPTVKPLTKQHIVQMAELVDGLNDGAFDAQARLLPSSITQGMEAFGHLRVDLRSSNTQLIAAFTEWLAVYRLEANFPQTKSELVTGSMINSPEFSSTGDGARVLAYEDLQLWLDWQGKTLSKVELVELLGVGDHDALETVIRRAKLLLSPGAFIATSELGN